MCGCVGGRVLEMMPDMHMSSRRDRQAEGQTGTQATGGQGTTHVGSHTGRQLRTSPYSFMTVKRLLEMRWPST